MNAGNSLRVILILSDGIRGHINQSRGVAHWLSQLTGAEILESEVPALTGTAKARAKTAARSLAAGGTRRDARGISEEMCVTLRFSLKILGKLVSSGIVESYKGNRGGYELARPASEITLKDVIDAVEGPYRLSRCVGEGGAGECNRGASGCCTFQKVFHDISKSINEQLAAVNFQMLLEEPAGK